jgi:hypothetical protein
LCSFEASNSDLARWDVDDAKYIKLHKEWKMYKITVFSRQAVQKHQTWKSTLGERARPHLPGTTQQAKIRRRIASEHEALVDVISQLNSLLQPKFAIDIVKLKENDPDTIRRLHFLAGTVTLSDLDVWEEICEEAFVLQDELNRTTEGLVVCVML